MKLLLIVSILALFLSVSSTNAQKSSAQIEKRIYTTKSVGNNKAPVIDGKLDDAVWDIVEWGADFIERLPDENTPPSEQTKFKIVYDAKYLYVGVRAYDKSPDSIVKRLGRRDSNEGDWVVILLDSYHDLRTSFGFIVSAAGVKTDYFGSENGNNEDISWNPVWTTKTTIDEEGWICEMKIPLSQLRFNNDDDQVWGLQVQRYFFRKGERSLWQRKPATQPGWESEFGELHGLKGLKPQRQFEIQPFTVIKQKTYPVEEGNPFRDGSDFNLNGGLDAKIGVTNDLTLDLTVNPDFGQVEADPAVIQLDGFQTFFREQRPFFVENKNIFNYRLSPSISGNTFGSDNIFHSRRIGRSPQGYPDVSDNAYVDQPINTTILGAAKFSGKTKKGWSIGVLESITDKEYAEIDDNGQRTKELVEPLTNYFVGRLQKDFNENNTLIGGIFTATNRKLEDNLDFLHKSAYVGGLDFKHQWKNRTWYVLGDIVMSHITGSEEAITNTQNSIRHLFNRVDAGHVDVDETRTSLTGTGGNIQLGELGGKIIFEGGFSWRSPELEFNDLGFQRTADDIRHNFWIGYKTLKPFGVFRRWQFNYNHFTAWDFEGNHNLLMWNVNTNMQFKNYWYAGGALNIKPIRFSNSALRGGPRLKNSASLSGLLWFETDNRKKIILDTFYEFFKDAAKSSYAIGIDIDYKPIDALSISIYPEFSKNNDKLQFVGNIETANETRYVNATIDQKTLSASIRLNYTINPDLTIQYYAQPFVSRGRYSDFKYITNPIAGNFSDRFQLYSDNQISYDTNNEVYLVDENLDSTTDYEIGNPDFSFVQFRSNLVIRWEYIPGSEIFLVWSQGVTSSTDPSDDLIRALETGWLNEKPENIFLIKMTYRFAL